MVTETRTTIRNDNGIVTKERSTANSNQAALWIVLAVLAFAGLGYAFYHYSNTATNPSMTNTPAATEQTTTPATSGTTLNNDTSTPNTATPSGSASEPAPTATPDSSAPASSSTAQ